MKKDENYKDILKNLGLISQLGISMISPILLGVFIGGRLGDWLGGKSFFVITFIILGVGAGFISVYKLTSPKNKRK